ncbi:MAG: HpcH/HpaI aldolase/citrate lyase family protein [Lautropia sp.]
MNSLKRKLEAGRIVGCIQTMTSADVTEVLAGTGIDMLMIDHEHGFGGLGDVVAQLRALKGTDVPALVRVPSHDPAYVHRLQDAGVASILFPGVERAEDAHALVRACRYPPAGVRGAGGGLRATDYDREPGYFARADADTLVAVQIETARGVAAAADICAVDGIGLVVIGPRDLSGSIGKLGRFDDAAVQALFAEAERRVLASGVPMGSTIYPGLTIAEMFARGHRLILAGTDVAFLSKSARDAARAPR